MTIDWSKSVTAATKKRVKELGEELNELLHASGVSDLETLQMKQTLAARIIAKVFRGEVRQLEQFAIESESATVPELSEVLDIHHEKSTEDK